MAGSQDHLVRVLRGFRALAEAGPLAVSQGEFHEKTAGLLQQFLAVVEAKQAVVLRFDPIFFAFRTILAVNAAVPDETRVPLGSSHTQVWNMLEHPTHLSESNIHGFFGAAPVLTRYRWNCVVPLRSAGELLGAVLMGERGGLETYSSADFELLQALGSMLALVMKNQALSESLAHQITDNLRLLNSVSDAYGRTLDAISIAIDSKDAYLEGHSKRVATFAAGIGESLGLSPEKIAGVRAAAQLHDIGKVTVDRSVLSKQSPLRPEEFREISDHTIVGDRIVSAVTFPWDHVREVVRSHHERADASGYPDKIHAVELPLETRMVAVADTFDAMTSVRPYRKAMSHVEAATEIAQLSPTKYDADVVQGLLTWLRCHCTQQEDPMFHDGLKPASAVELDHISHQLLRRVTGNRVFSA